MPQRELLKLLFDKSRVTLGTGLGVIICALAVYFGLQVPAILREAIDGIRSSESWWEMAPYGFYICAANILNSLCYNLSRYIFDYVSLEVMCDARAALYARLVKHESGYLRNRQVSEVTVQLTEELEAHRSGAVQLLIDVLTLLLTAAVVFPMVMNINQRLAALLALTVTAGTILLIYLGARLKYVPEKLPQQKTMYAYLDDDITNVRVVRAYNREHDRIGSFANNLQLWLQQSVRRLYYNAALTPLTQLILGIVFLSNAAYSSFAAYDGVITVGQFMEFNILIMRLSWPLTSLAQIMRLMRDLMQQISQYRKIFAETKGVSPSYSPQPPPPPRGNVEYCKVNVFADSCPILQEIELTAEPGTVTGIVGPNRSGKTTLLLLLLRQVEPETESLYLDGVSIAKYSQAQLRAAISYLNHDPFLFDGTIADNIAFGGDVGKTMEVWEAAEIAGLAADLRNMPHRLQTRIGRNGELLSGGQRQRLALARAVFRKPAILLLDQALAAVDSHTEKLILNNLKVSRPETTLFIVTHRIGVLVEADRICFLNRGRISEQGTHAELYRVGGGYKTLYEAALIRHSSFEAVSTD